jgi:hypothetical protein
LAKAVFKEDTMTLKSTGSTRIDRILQGIISRYEQVFPDRIRGYYVVGSYSDGDVDMMIVFKEGYQADEHEKAVALKDVCRLISPIHLDLPDFSEETLQQTENVAFKLGSTLIYGEDIRDQYLRHIVRPAHPPLPIQWIILTRTMNFTAMCVRWI